MPTRETSGWGNFKMASSRILIPPTANAKRRFKKLLFKVVYLKAPNHYSCASHFLHIPFIYLGLCWNRENWHELENRLPRNYGPAGNPARQSSSVHAVNKYSEICSNPLRNIFYWQTFKNQ
jgi:hypothetical protein